MDSSLNELWTERKSNQRLSLIGTNLPGEGNGYHDRISFDSLYSWDDGDIQDDGLHSDWLYSVYFRDIANALNPQYTTNRGKDFLDNLVIENCSTDYRETFMKYANDPGSWRSGELLETIGGWGDHLIHQGRVVIEFVGWYDNESNNFYGFQLKHLDLYKCKIKSDFIYYTGCDQVVDGIARPRTVKIPRDKCIIIDWPQSLGGFEGYERRVETILAIGNKYDDVNKNEREFNPLLSYERMNNWDIKFRSLTSAWGIMSTRESTTDFYTQYDRLKLKGTVILCMQSIIEGLQSLINMLNQKLGESAVLKLNHEPYDHEVYLSFRTKWLKGEATFKEINDYLSAK